MLEGNNELYCLSNDCIFHCHKDSVFYKDSRKLEVNGKFMRKWNCFEIVWKHAEVELFENFWFKLKSIHVVCDYSKSYYWITLVKCSWQYYQTRNTSINIFHGRVYLSSEEQKLPSLVRHLWSNSWAPVELIEFQKEGLT